MSSFDMKKSRIVDKNKDLDEIVATEVKYDLNRQKEFLSQSSINYLGKGFYILTYALFYHA